MSEIISSVSYGERDNTTPPYTYLRVSITGAEVIFVQHARAPGSSGLTRVELAALFEKAAGILKQARK